jgi:threonine synthase
MPWCVLKCSNCGRLYGLGERVWRCSCGGVLDVVCEGRVFDPDPKRRGVWRYLRTLPPWALL